MLLQEQLMEKDIPFLQSVLPKKFTAAYMKGRNNYVCLQRLKRAEGSPVLDGLEAVDDPSEVRRVYGAEPSASGLGLVRFRLVPHVDSPTHSESAALDAIADRYAAEGVEHIRLRDGEALVIDGDNQAIVGSPATVEELLY